MNKKVSTILLVDDDLAINFLHKRIVTKSEIGESVIALYNGVEALRNLKDLNHLIGKKN